MNVTGPRADVGALVALARRERREDHGALMVEVATALRSVQWASSVVLRGLADSEPAEDVARLYLMQLDRQALAALPPLLRVRVDLFVGRETG